MGKNNEEWTPWLMMLRGDISVVAPTNDLNEKVSVVAESLRTEKERAENAEKGLQKAIDAEAANAKDAHNSIKSDITEQSNRITQTNINLHKCGTARFDRIEENVVEINKGEIGIENPRVVYYKPKNIFVAVDNAGNYWDTWSGMASYMSGGKIREDKVYLCGVSTYTWNGRKFSANQHYGNLEVEIGGVSDSTFLPTTNPQRARCCGIPRKDIVHSTIQSPTGWLIWIQAFDENMKWIRNIPDLWNRSRSSSTIKGYDSNIAFFNFVFKKESEDEITDADISELSEFLYSITHKPAAYEMHDLNKTADNITIDANRIIINNNGFCLIDNESVKYFVGYVPEEDTEDTLVLDGGRGAITRRYVYINASALKANARVSFSKAIVVSDEQPLFGNYILFAFWGAGVLTGNGLMNPVYIKMVERNAMINTPIVEIGGVTDDWGEPYDSEYRIRCMYIPRKDIQTAILTKPAGLRLWVQYVKADKTMAKIMLDDLWNKNKPIDVSKLENNAKYFNFAFKRDDEGEITDEDLRIAKEYVSNLLTYFPKTRDYLIKYNLGKSISVSGRKVSIMPSGFGIEYPEGSYWIADASRARTEPYVFEFNANSNGYVVVDTTKLVTLGVRTELSDVVSIKEHPVQSDIVIAYYYSADNKLSLMGQFRTLYGDTPNYNNEVLFSPEFYAYKHGRRNRENGAGVGWYERFRITHISDVHNAWNAVSEALTVSNQKTNMVINTGDDSNGTTSSNASTIKTDLATATANIRTYANIPYMQVPGNHDVPGLTKKEYFDIVGATVQQYTKNVVWGDASNYRSYGYADFTDASYEGDFRVIMLDPFDYDDGMFESVYPHMTAVFSQKQIDWLIGVLVDAADKGLNVITAMHYSFGDADYSNELIANPDAAYFQDAFMIPDIIDAIQNKTALTKEYPDTKGYNNIVINRDFSSTSDLKFVAHLFGHIHSKNHYQCQKADGSKKYDILMLGEAALTVYGTALNKAYREVGTINGIAFSALEIDVVEKAVYRVAYGAYLNYDKSNSERTTKIPYRFDE